MKKLLTLAGIFDDSVETVRNENERNYTPGEENLGYDVHHLT